MKWYKKILAVLSFCTLLTTANCFAVTLENTQFNNDKSECIKTYQVMESEKENFLKQLESEIEIDGVVYKYIDYDAEGENTKTTIDINTSKKIVTKTNNKNKIIDELGKTLNYREDGFEGEYTLDINSITIKKNYNGYYEKLIDKTINYNNLDKNDLSYIPKQIKSDNLTLDLLKVEWEAETNKNIGEYEVANTYTAKCYYATKQKIDYPYTYTVSAEYFGTATKVEENPIVFNVKYEKQKEETPEQKLNIIPILGGTSGIVLVIIFFATKNITVYNLNEEGTWRKVGKTRLKRNEIVKLNKFALFERTNKYKLVFSRRISNKIKGKLITVLKYDNKVQKLATIDNGIQVIYEVRI